MLQTIVEYVAGLVKEQLEEMLQEVIAKLIELLGEDEGIVEEWLDSLSPTKQMFARQLITFMEMLLEKVAEELLKDEPVEPVG